MYRSCVCILYIEYNNHANERLNLCRTKSLLISKGGKGRGRYREREMDGDDEEGKDILVIFMALAVRFKEVVCCFV